MARTLETLKSIRMAILDLQAETDKIISDVNYAVNIVNSHFSAGTMHFPDDVRLTFGGTPVAYDAWIEHDTAAAPDQLLIQNQTAGEDIHLNSANDLLITVGGSVSIQTGNLYIRSQNELRFYDNGNYVGFEAGALGANQIWILPTADGAAGTVLSTNGAGTLSWAAGGAIVAPGADTQVIYNAGGVLAAEAAFTYDYNNNILTADSIRATIDCSPNVSDGATLGTNALEWSDLYLADGGVIYFGDDQDVTLTHVADARLSLNLALTVNSSTSDLDTIISGTSANLFYCDAGNNRIGVLTSAPSEVLTILGSTNIAFNELGGILLEDSSGNDMAQLTWNIMDNANRGAFEIEVNSTGLKSMFFISWNGNAAIGNGHPYNESNAADNTFTVVDTGACYLNIVSDVDANGADDDSLIRFYVDGVPGTGTLSGIIGYDQGLDLFRLGYAGDADITIDTSGNVNIANGNLTITTGNIIIPDAGNIGSASDTDAIAIAAGGEVTLSQTLILSDVVNAGVDTDKFLVLDVANNVDFRTGAEVLSDIGGASTAHKDTHDPQTGSDPLDCAAAGEIVGVTAAAEGTADTLARSDHTHQIQHSIADNHIVTIDDADAADDDYAKFTANGLEGRSYAEVLSDIGASPDTHLHDGDTLQHDGVNSDGGAYSFTTTGAVTFNQQIIATGGVVPAVSDGASLGSTTLEWADLYLADSSYIYFGDDQEVSFLHYPDVGVRIASATGNASFAINAGADIKYPLRVENTTVDTTSTYQAFRNIHIKTDGATDQNDDIAGIWSTMEMNDADSTIGVLRGGYIASTLTSGTIGTGIQDMYGLQAQAVIAGGTVSDDVFGFYSRSNIDGGTITGDIYAGYFSTDIEAAVTSIGGNVYGIYIFVDADKDPVGTAYALYINDATNIDYGIYQAGSSLNVFGGDVAPLASDGSALGTTDLEWADLYLADGSIIYFGDDQDVTLTHVADTGILLNAAMQIQFRDAALLINSSADGQLDIDADTEVEITAPTLHLVSSTEIDMDTNVVDIGTGADTDITLNFVANTSSGVLKWMEDEDCFQFDDAIFLPDDIYIEMGNTAAIPDSRIYYEGATSELIIEAGIGSVAADIRLKCTCATANIYLQPVNGQIFADDPIKIKEQAAADADTVGYGQLWVKNTTPCELWFTDDAGTDTQIV